MFGYGTVLQIKTGTTGSPLVDWTAVGEIYDMDGPSLQRDAVDATTHDSPDGYKEAEPGLRDGGDVNFSLYLDPDNEGHLGTNGLLDQFNTDSIYDYRIIYPDETDGWAFSGFLTKLGPFKAAINELVSGDCTIKVTGKPVYGVFA
jgi:hypothetical protein